MASANTPAIFKEVLLSRQLRLRSYLDRQTKEPQDNGCLIGYLYLSMTSRMRDLATDLD